MTDQITDIDSDGPTFDLENEIFETNTLMNLYMHQMYDPDFVTEIARHKFVQTKTRMRQLLEMRDRDDLVCD